MEGGFVILFQRQTWLMSSHTVKTFCINNCCLFLRPFNLSFCHLRPYREVPILGAHIQTGYTSHLDQQQDDLLRISKVRLILRQLHVKKRRRIPRTRRFSLRSQSSVVVRCATPQEYSCIDLSVCISIGSAVNCYPSHPPVGGRDSRQRGRRGIDI